MLNNPKLANIVQKIELFRSKFRKFVFLEFFSLWILKGIVGYEDKFDIIKVNALQYPVNRLVVAPCIGVCLIVTMLMIITYFPDVITIEPIAYVLIITILWGFMAIVSLPFNYFLYPVNPYVKNFFKTNGPNNTIIEFRFVTKLLYISISIMLFFSFVTYFLNTQNFEELANNDLSFLRFFSIIIVISSTMISIMGILKFAMLILQKNFRFYLAKSSLGLSIEINNEYEKMQYVIFGLNSYNVYLKKLLKLQFKNINNITEKIISDSPENMNKSIKELYDKFEIENFKIIRYLADFVKLDSEERDFLTKTTSKDKIIEWSPVAAIFISVFISLIQSLPAIWDTISELIQNNWV